MLILCHLKNSSLIQVHVFWLLAAVDWVRERKRPRHPGTTEVFFPFRLDLIMPFRM